MLRHVGPPNKRMQPTPLARLAAAGAARLQVGFLRGCLLRRRGAADAQAVMMDQRLL
jgi:hypothetical protein